MLYLYPSGFSPYYLFTLQHSTHSQETAPGYQSGMDCPLTARSSLVVIKTVDG